MVTSAWKFEGNKTTHADGQPCLQHVYITRGQAGRTRLPLGSLDDLAVLLEVDRPRLDVARSRLDVELEDAVRLLDGGLSVGVGHLGERVGEALVCEERRKGADEGGSAPGRQAREAIGD